MVRKAKLTEDVLPVEQFKAWREEGLSFEAIGERVGYSGTTVGAYVKRVLPEHLWGKTGGRGTPRRSTAQVQKVEGCVRCDRPQGKIDPDSGLCENCRRKLSRGEDFLAGSADDDDIHAQLRKTADEAAERKRRELIEKRDEEKKRPTVAKVRKKAEQQSVEVVAPSEIPLPDLQEGLFIAAGGNGTAAALVTGPGGLQDVLAQQQAHEAWCGFLGSIAPDGELDGLAGMAPPCYVRTDADRWEHLRQIAAGYVVAGRRSRKRAHRFLADGTPSVPVVSRSTARKLDLLARLARWLIAREG